MTSATTQPARGPGGRHLEGHGLILFASVMLVIIGCFNLIDGIPAYPFWSLTIIAADVVALYGLCAYSSHANRTA